MRERWRTHDLLLARGVLWDGTAEHAGFDAWCRAHRGQRCRLWLAAPLLIELVAEPDLPLANDEAALAWARGLLAHYHGPMAEAWPLAAWRQGGMRGVSVLHGVPLDALRHAAEAQRVRLAAASPWWALALQLALRDQRGLREGEARLVVVEGLHVVAIDLQSGRVQSLALRLLDAAEPGALDEWNAALPPRPTHTVGYGLSGGPLQRPWPEAAALHAPLAWQ